MRLDSPKSHALGVVRKRTPQYLEVDLDADASGGIAVSAPFDCTIIGMKAISKATVTSATVTLSAGANDISDAVDIDTVDTVINAATLDMTYTTVLKGAALTLTTASAADRAIVLIEVLPR